MLEHFTFVSTFFLILLGGTAELANQLGIYNGPQTVMNERAVLAIKSWLGVQEEVFKEG
jgi:hypothetical protein